MKTPAQTSNTETTRFRRLSVLFERYFVKLI